MTLKRREFLAMSGVAAIAMGTGVWGPTGEGGDMYGLIGKMRAAEGKRDQLIKILLEASANMPGCLSYVVAKDDADANGIWITEVWDSKSSHDASLSLPAVKNAIEQGRPFIAGFGERFVTEPIGGHGLARR